MNSVMMAEKMETPKSKMKLPNSLSASLFGTKSPRPTVERLVNVKYVSIIYMSKGSLFYKSYCTIKVE